MKSNIVSIFFLTAITVFSIDILNAQQNSTSWKTNYDKGKKLSEDSDYKSALSYLQSAYQIAKKSYKESDWRLEASVSLLGNTYKQLEEYEKSLPLLKEDVHLVEGLKGKQHSDYANSLSNLASLYYDLANYKTALPLFIEALESAKKNIGKNHKDYGNFLYNLGGLYQDMEDFQKALPLYLECVENTEKNLGKNHRLYSSRLNDLGLLYYQMGDNQKALPLYLEALKNRENNFGKYSIDYSESLNNLAVLYYSTEEYQKALPLFSASLENRARNFGKYNSDYVDSLNNLAALNFQLGDYQKALPLYLEALENREKISGKDNPDYGKILNNLGALYQNLGDYQKALPMYTEALDNRAKNFGKNNFYYGQSLSNLATTYYDSGNYPKALPLFKEAIENIKKSLGQNHSTYGIRLNNLAKCYQRMGDYQNALPLYLEALENVEKSLGRGSTNYGVILNNLASFYFGAGAYEKAWPYTSKSNENLLLQIEKIFNFRSEKEKKVFLETFFDPFNLYQSMGIAMDNSIIKYTELNLNNQLILKGLLLNSSKNILEKLASINNNSINEKLADARSLKSQLSKLYNMPIEKRDNNIDSLNVLINEAEVDLITEYTSRFTNSYKLRKDWNEIQRSLSKHEVAIEFSHFQYISTKRSTDSIFYAAYLTKKEWAHPKVVYLFEKKQLTSILNKKSPNQLYASRGSIIAKSRNTTAYRDSIYALVWKPLEQYLTKGETIYYAPDGLLNQLPFAALGTKKGKMLGDKYNLIQLSSTGKLTEPEKEPTMDNPLLIGGIDYDFLPVDKKETVEKQFAYIESASVKDSKGTRGMGESWNYLAGTKKETDNIKMVYDAKGKAYQVFTGSNAAEENFKKLSGHSPKVLHIATHGFFFENTPTLSKANLESTSQYKYAEDPLLRSGLILAGANYAWKNGSNPYTEDDGILTSMEISNLDLSKTDLVVLSACDTGLGDMDASEGVYGLQRAFKMAGVNYIIMSLWQVPDLETAEFMKLFYGNWLNGKPIREAFSKAQKTMRKKYSEEPLKWAGFVLFE